MRVLFIICFVFFGQQISAQVFEVKLEAAKEEDIKEGVNEEKDVFTAVEFRAEYPGGIKRFEEDFNKEFSLSTIFIDRDSLLLIISFIVEIDGSVSNAKALRYGDKEVNIEVKRVFDLLDVWKPALNKGVIVRNKITRAIKVFKKE
ncbi:hypothetical protein [Myroides sp.]|uniref:hypothetical protein n=1 Tax=Myroides sp. TaxID=1874736 RepID=UPI0028A6ABA1|nr:hypothetical protein [Myroides sp.]